MSGTPLLSIKGKRQDEIILDVSMFYWNFPIITSQETDGQQLAFYQEFPCIVLTCHTNHPIWPLRANYLYHS